MFEFTAGVVSGEPPVSCGGHIPDRRHGPGDHWSPAVQQYSPDAASTCASKHEWEFSGSAIRTDLGEAGIWFKVVALGSSITTTV